MGVSDRCFLCALSAVQFRVRRHQSRRIIEIATNPFLKVLERSGWNEDVSFANPDARPGFTLIDRLVVFAIIEISVSQLLPGLGNAKPNFLGVCCFSTERQLGGAMYFASKWRRVGHGGNRGVALCSWIISVVRELGSDPAGRTFAATARSRVLPVIFVD